MRKFHSTFTGYELARARDYLATHFPEHSCAIHVEVWHHSCGSLPPVTFSVVAFEKDSVCPNGESSILFRVGERYGKEPHHDLASAVNAMTTLLTEHNNATQRS